MAFSDWKTRSRMFADLYGRLTQSQMAAVDGACKAAYMAGYRAARKDTEEIAKRAIELRELMRSNAELSGPRPLAAEGSRSNDVLERTAGKGEA